MSFEGNGIKLIGDDGHVQKATFGASIIAGDGLATLDVGIYFITAVAAVSGFPAPALGGNALAAGNFLVVDTAGVITPEVGDDVILMTLTDRCDITSITMDFARGEIETTVLCDPEKTFRSGRPDMTGTMEGVNTVGITDDPDLGFMRQFIDIIKQDGSTSADVFPQTNEILLGLFYVNYENSGIDDMFVVAAYTLQGFSLGGAVDGAQTFSSGFRFASYNEPLSNIPIRPQYYRVAAS